MTYPNVESIVQVTKDIKSEQHKTDCFTTVSCPSNSTANTEQILGRANDSDSASSSEATSPTTLRPHKKSR